MSLVPAYMQITELNSKVVKDGIPFDLLHQHLFFTACGVEGLNQDQDRTVRFSSDCRKREQEEHGAPWVSGDYCTEVAWKLHRPECLWCQGSSSFCSAVLESVNHVLASKGKYIASCNIWFIL